MLHDMEQVNELIGRGALFVVNHSGGKDSQVMLIRLRRIVPADQLLVIHADLPGADWPGTWDHVLAYADDLPVLKCRSVKTFEEMVRHRGMFPSPKYRQCTSDLKRNPIERTVRRYLKDHPEFNGLVVNCMGMRAEESPNRAKLKTLKRNEKNSKAGREWYDWLPVHHLLEWEVFAQINDANERPLWVYAAGMSRASCVFCIMASEEDLRTAARLAPDVLARYDAMEADTGFAMMMPRKGKNPRTLKEIVGA